MEADRILGGAMGRHPSARWERRDLHGMARRLAGGMDRIGAPHPMVGASAVVTRGTTGCTIGSFAERFGVDVAVVAALEAGQVPVGAVPPPIAVLTPVAAIHGRLVEPHGPGG